MSHITNWTISDVPHRRLDGCWWSLFQKQVAMLSGNMEGLKWFHFAMRAEENNEQIVPHLCLSNLLLVLIANVIVCLQEKCVYRCPAKAKEFRNVLGCWQLDSFSGKWPHCIAVDGQTYSPWTRCPDWKQRPSPMRVPFLLDPYGQKSSYLSTD